MKTLLLSWQECGKELSRKLALQWLGRSQPLVNENVVEHIVDRVFVDDEHIYSCVDIGVGDVLEDGTLLIVASIAGYAPRPFGKNWTGRDGPFVHLVGGPFLNKMAGYKDSWSVVENSLEARGCQRRLPVILVRAQLNRTADFTRRFWRNFE